MARWLTRVVRRIRQAAREGAVRFTYKALREMAACGEGYDADDGRAILEGLSAGEFVLRLAGSGTGEWMYVFKPVVGEETLYVKVVLREGCTVISLHEDRPKRQS